MTKFKLEDLDDYSIDGVDPKDFPDFSDAFLGEATTKDGHELTDEELDYIQNAYPDWINEQAFQSLI